MRVILLLLSLIAIVYSISNDNVTLLDYISQELDWDQLLVEVLHSETSYEYVALLELDAWGRRVKSQHISDTSTTLRLLYHEQEVSITVSEDFNGFRGITAFESTDSFVTHSNGLRVMSINIWNHNWWEMRVEAIADEIFRANPDVICFQEVRARKISHLQTGRFQVHDLAQALGMTDRFQWISSPAMHFAESSSGHQEWVFEGLAMFSRLPIVSWEVLELTRDPRDSADFHQRIALSAVVLSEFGWVQVITTHLSLSHIARERSLNELSEFAKLSHLPVILAGDFNCESEEVMGGLVNSPFIDTWVELEGASPGYTFNSWDIKSRIDFIFLSSGGVLKPLSASIFGDVPITIEENLPPLGGVDKYNHKMYPSDHLFLSVDFARL